MSGQVKHFFARGNTAKGLYNLTDSAYQGLDTVYVVQGFAGGTAQFIGGLATECIGRGWNVQLIHHPLQQEVLEGIILNDLSVGVVDNEAWPSDCLIEGTEIKYIDLHTALNSDQIAKDEAQIERLTSERDAAYEKAYATFEKALRIHDEWEVFYIKNLDRDFMNQLAVEWTNANLGAGHADKQASVTHRFFGAATSAGPVDFITNLTENIDIRIFVKGRPGTGKSTLFKKLPPPPKQEASIQKFTTAALILTV